MRYYQFILTIQLSDITTYYALIFKMHMISIMVSFNNVFSKKNQNYLLKIDCKSLAHFHDWNAIEYNIANGIFVLEKVIWKF